MRNQYLRVDRKLGITLLYILLAILTFMRYGLEIDIPQNVLLVIALLIVSFGNTFQIVAMCMCCIPLYTSFNYLYVTLYGSIILLLKKNKGLRFDCSIIIVVTIFLWELLHSFEGSFSISQLIAIIVPYIFYIILRSCWTMEQDYGYIGLMFARFVTLVGINLFTRTVLGSGGNIVYAIQRMKRLGNVDEDSIIVGGHINPNGLGILCVLAISILIQIYFYVKREKKILVYMFLLAGLGFLTLSRTYIVLLTLMLALFFLERKGSTNEKIKLIGIITCILVIGGIILTAYFPTMTDTFMNRWKVSDLSNGRFSIMTETSECIWFNPKILFWGIGLQDYSENVLKYVSVAPHDSIHEILMAWGIPGLILFMLLLVSMIMSAKKKNKNMGLINYIPLIIIVAKAMAGHWITSGYTMLATSLAYLSLVHDFRDSLSMYKKRY